MFKKLCFIAAGVVVASCAFANSEVRVALNWKPEPQFGGFYEAQRLDLFKKNQLNVRLVPGGSGTPTLQMLAAKQTEYAIVSADEMIMAQDRGVKDLIALFAVYQTNPQGIMVHSSRGFKSLEDVFKNEGTLLWQAGLPYASFLKKKYAPLKVKEAPYSGGISLFQNSPKISQQIFVTSEPLQAEESGLKIQTFLVADSGFNPYTTVLITTRQRLAQNQKEVLALRDIFRESWESYLKSPELTNQRMHKLNPSLSLEFFAKSAAAQKDLILTQKKDIKIGSMSLQRWTELQDQLIDLGLIKKAQPAELYFLKDE